MNICFLIWLLGVIPTYLIVKYFYQKKKNQNWLNVSLRVGSGILWPFALLILILEYLGDILDNTKPPRWL